MILSDPSHFKCPYFYDLGLPWYHWNGWNQSSNSVHWAQAISSISLRVTNYPKLAWWRLFDQHNKFGAYDNFGLGEAIGTSVWVYADWYWQIVALDRLPQKRVCAWSQNLFNLWEITDNILETVQNRRLTYNGRLTEHCMCPIEGIKTNDVYWPPRSP